MNKVKDSVLRNFVDHLSHIGHCTVYIQHPFTARYRPLPSSYVRVTRTAQTRYYVSGKVQLKEQGGFLVSKRLDRLCRSSLSGRGYLMNPPPPPKAPMPQSRRGATSGSRIQTGLAIFLSPYIGRRHMGHTTLRLTINAFHSKNRK